MYHTLLGDASFWAFLFAVDQDLAATRRNQGCSCGGRLHCANYPRQPRGCGNLPESYGYRTKRPASLTSATGSIFSVFAWRIGVGQGGTLVPQIKVPRKATTRIIQRLKEVMPYRPLQESGATRIVRGSVVIRGWSNYFRIAHNFSQAANTLDHQAFWIATKALCRKFDLTTAKCLHRYRFGSVIGIDESCTLMRAQDVKMVSRLLPPEPYQPGTGCYLEDLDWEVDFRLLERRRPGRMDTKVLALFRDGYRCRKCGVRVTYGNSEADHIVPVRRFASFQQANVPLNLQILCLECHKAKTAASR